MALTLISALTLPSYATVGASDGSAFVTKAEFDAALSDFNARLTTFEAGINSKIDSQVSSYLDRNGIWNGKRQLIYDDLKTSRWDNCQYGVQAQNDNASAWFYPKELSRPGYGTVRQNNPYDSLVMDLKLARGQDDVARANQKKWLYAKRSATVYEGYRSDDVYNDDCDLTFLPLINKAYGMSKSRSAEKVGSGYLSNTGFYRGDEYILIPEVTKSGLCVFDVATHPTDERWSMSYTQLVRDGSVFMASYWYNAWGIISPYVTLNRRSKNESLPYANFNEYVVGIMPGLNVQTSYKPYSELKASGTGFSTVEPMASLWPLTGVDSVSGDMTAPNKGEGCFWTILSQNPMKTQLQCFVSKGDVISLSCCNASVAQYVSSWGRVLEYWLYETEGVYGCMGWDIEASVY